MKANSIALFHLFGPRQNREALTKKLEEAQRHGQPRVFTGKAAASPAEDGRRVGPLRQKLVVEVQFEPFTGGRFRHGTRFFGWRPEKEGRDHKFQPVERETRSVLGSAVIASCWRSAQPDIKTTNERRRAIEP